jgi:hypothetical protein
LEKIKHGFKTLAECGGIRGVDDTSSLKLHLEGNSFVSTGRAFQSFIALQKKHEDSLNLILGITKFLFVALLVLLLFITNCSQR